MLSKYIIPALCAVQAVAAVSHHRHLHDLHKKDIEYAATEVTVVTEYVTKTVIEGEEEATPTALSMFAGKKPASKTRTRSRRPRPSSTTAVEESTSAIAVETTSFVVVEETTTPSPTPTTTPVAVVIEEEAPSVDLTSAAAAFTEAVADIVSEVVAPITSVIAAIPTPTIVASTGGSKRGIAYNDASLVSSVMASLGGKFSWAYNWGATSGSIPSSLKYYPTCWSPGKSQGWAANAAKAIANGADALFSFNEPDIASQAAMSPAAAAAGHIELMVPFAGQARIGAPSISSSQNVNQGTSWLTQFFTACNGGCAIDFCNAHWYGPGGKAGAEEFLGHLVNVQKACGGKPVWVTEFKAEDSAENEAAFIQHALSELDNNSKYSFVEKYAYFFVSNGFLATGNSLNTLGQLYATT